MTLSKPIRDHLRRVLPEVCHGGIPMTLGQVESAITAARHVEWAHVDGQLRAFAELRINLVSPHRWTVSCAVERAYQGRGLGRQVLAAALHWADEHGAEWVDGVAWAHNERVLALDLSLGFEEIGRIPDAYRAPSGERYTQVLLVRRRPPT